MIRSSESFAGRRARPSLISLVVLTLLAGCTGTSPDAEGESWQVVRDTIGETVVVRTVAGSVWGEDAVLVPEVSIGALDGPEELLLGSVRSLAVGQDGEIYVMDAQVPALRVYAADGAYLRTLGGEGEGPGEYKRPDGGLAVLSDGRIVLRDPSNARFNVYSAEGESLDTWIVRGNFNTSRRLYRDRHDNLWTLVLVDPEASVFDWVKGLARYGPDGVVGDTLVEPDYEYEAPTISGRREGSSSVRSVPFSPTESWTMSPLGYLVGGVSTDYSFTLYRSPDEGQGPPLRIERRAEPVPVHPDEGRQARERATQAMRSQYPGWKWNGPDVPDHKPPFEDLHVGLDGRIWVEVAQPGFEVENPDHDPREEGSFPTEWKEPVAFDVFEPDGRYLGRVRAPSDFRTSPDPIFGTDRVWAVTRDDLDVQRVVRFRIERKREVVGDEG